MIRSHWEYWFPVFTTVFVVFLFILIFLICRGICNIFGDFGRLFCCFF